MRIVATYEGAGNWNRTWQPDAGAFTRELSNYDVSGARVLSPYGGNFYIVSFNIDTEATALTNTPELARGHLENYFRQYFDNFNLRTVSGTVINSGTGFWGGATTGNTGGGQYTVVSGDTFSKIAARFGLSVTQLKALNPQIANINIIAVGQKINVSGATATVPIVTGVTPSGNATVTPIPQNTIQPLPFLPNNNSGAVTPNTPKKDNGWDGFAKKLGVGAGVLTVLAVAVGVVVLMPRD